MHTSLSFLRNSHNGFLVLWSRSCPESTEMAGRTDIQTRTFSLASRKRLAQAWLKLLHITPWPPAVIPHPAWQERCCFSVVPQPEDRKTRVHSTHSRCTFFELERLAITLHVTPSKPLQVLTSLLVTHTHTGRTPEGTHIHTHFHTGPSEPFSTATWPFLSSRARSERI